MIRRTAILAIAFAPVLALCQEVKEQPSSAPAEPKPAAAKKVRLKTNKGDIVIELNAEKAPVTVANFLNYVEKKHYDGTVFHRVIGTFMIQGGGFSPEGAKLVEKPTGKAIVNEGKNGLKNDRGTIAMARTNELDSATAQFFINVKDNPNLNFPSNGGYAVFGKVVEGMEVVDKIKAVATGQRELDMLNKQTGQKITMPAPDVPVENVVILSAKAE